MHDAVWVTDLEGRITHWNRSAEEIYGYSCDEIVGRRHDLLMPAGETGTPMSIVRAVGEHGHWSGLQRVQRKDGSEGLLELDVHPLQDFSGTLVAMLGVARDVTGTMLGDDRLRQAEKMKAIGQVAGGIAHEFGDALTAILCYSDLLLSRLKDPSLRAKVEEMRMAGERAAGLTRQLVRFSRAQLLQQQVVDPTG